MDILTKLLGPVRLKVLRFFLQHEEGLYEDKAISKTLKVSVPSLRKELRSLETAGILKHKIAHVIPTSTRERRRKYKGWYLVKQPIVSPLKRFIFNSVPFRADEVIKRLKGVGKLKLIVLAGAFIQSDESPIDILVVGDGIRRTAAESVLRTMESEVGRELNYAIFETDDFLYRMEAFDKFVREIFENPHQVILDRINIRSTR